MSFVFDCVVWAPVIAALVQLSKKWITIDPRWLAMAGAILAALIPMFKPGHVGQTIVQILVCIVATAAAAIGTFELTKGTVNLVKPKL